ncbi:MAG: right-handed parallel beta-helix repeat-containing protein [Muribaculaceae bacterium]|nr:right-handed parallel beta-helix repeat-containing protein [Muribaculaceae bacterium]
MKKYIRLIPALFLILSIGASGKNYYIDPAGGSDNADGRAPQQAWQTIAPLADVTLQRGDSLLFKRGTEYHGQVRLSASGKPGGKIVVGAYGTGDKPKIVAPDKSDFAVEIRNSNHLTLCDLEVVNTGSKRLAGRTGVKVVAEDCGVSADITLSRLYIHDVNGSLVKQEGGGSGLFIVNGGKSVPSIFDGLLIEDCVIRRCERNAIIWSGIANRAKWNPNRGVVVRRNLIDQVPGDGIVPIGCDGAIIEYNVMRDCPGILPHTEAAAGIWPWSCDNTIVRFNEVSGHKAPWDAQGFDSDYNCTNTVIQYNYSHDNDGGMVLICNSGTDRGVGNRGTVVEYNVSINDAIRPRGTRAGIFAPSIHIGGPVRDTRVSRNILHVNPKAETFMDRSIITSDSWDGYADSTLFEENVFFVPEQSAFRMTESTANTFRGNYYIGSFIDKPADGDGHYDSAFYRTLTGGDITGFSGLDGLFDTLPIADGRAVLKAVNPERIEDFFSHMADSK